MIPTFFVGVLVLVCPELVDGEYAPDGCTFNTGNGNSGLATCDFTSWDPPLIENDFGPGDVDRIVIENVDGTIPNQAFSGIESKTNVQNAEIKFKCDLENVLLSPEVFTPNLDWIKILTFKSCYVQDGIPEGMLSNLTSLEEFTVDGGIIGPLSSNTFTGLTELQKITINADFLDGAIPTGMFSSLTKVEEIDLKSSGISSLEVDTFTGLSLMTKLDLSGNSLTTLPDEMFTSLTSLSTVKLGSNAWACTCDLAWLSTWALYTGVSIDVTCATPAEYSGVSLSRAVASLGCINSASTTTTTGTASSGSQVSSGGSSSSGGSDGNNDYLLYTALGLAGFSSLMALITSFTLCWVCKKLETVSDSRRDSGRAARSHKARQTTVSTISERPPSYYSTDRIYINTPVQSHRDSRVHPMFDVNYKKRQTEA